MEHNGGSGGKLWVLLRKLLVAKEAGTGKEGTLILARKEGWYCQGRKLAKEAPWLMGSGLLPKMEGLGQGSADMGRESVRFLVSGR